MAFARSDQNASRYARGGATAVKGNKLGWWERKVYKRSPTDIPLTISPRYHQRPDLLAADLYGNDNLMWFVLQYNAIVDTHTEFVQNAQIILPTRTRLYTELLSVSS